MCDSVVLLRKGGVAYSGPPTDLDEQSFLRDYLAVDFEEASGGRIPDTMRLVEE
jgi:ABC-type multidrug transport system ATPase subunit